MSLCPFNGFEPCPEACAFAAEGACGLVAGMAAIAKAVAGIEATPTAGTQTVMSLPMYTPEEYVTRKGVDHYDGMPTKSAFLELRLAMDRGEVVGDAMPQRVVTNLVIRCHPSLYVNGHGSISKFKRIGGEND